MFTVGQSVTYTEDYLDPSGRRQTREVTTTVVSVSDTEVVCANGHIFYFFNPPSNSAFK